jgi:uncharacterized protein (TIRG00374 family)
MHWLKSKQFKFIISLLVSSSILFIIYRRVDFDVLKETLLKISPVPAIIFIILILIQLILSAARWNILTRQLGGVKFTFFTSLQQVVGSYSANLVVPGKWGEIIRIPWMKKYSLKIPVILMVLLEKALDTLSVVTILFFSLLILVIKDTVSPVPLRPIFIATSIVMIIILFLIAFRNKMNNLFSSFLDKRTRLKNTNGFLSKLKILFVVTSDKIWLYYGFSLVLWILQVFQFYFIFLMLGIRLSVVYTYAGGCLALLAGVIPISIAGIGTRDAVIIGFFNHLAPFELLAGAGILSLMRIIIPALIGIPFFIIQTKES